MNELYWITRFDSICGFLIFLTIIFGVIAGINIFMCVDEDDDDFIIKHRRNATKHMIIAIIIGLVTAFIPSTKEALIIYGVGGTIDYVKSDSTAKQLPKKAILALDKYLNEITDDKN